MIEMFFALALAGQQATTTCREFGGTMTCNTMPTFPPPAPVYVPRRSPSVVVERSPEACADRAWLLAGCTRGQHDAARATRDARVAREALTRTVTLKLAEGDCAGAVQAALEGGDMALAREARDFCQPAP